MDDQVKHRQARAPGSAPINHELSVIRATEFPFLEERVYLDTAAIGLPPSSLERASEEYYQALRRGMVGRSHWQEKAQQVRETLGGLLGVTPNQVEFVGSTTDALNLIAHSVKWRRGERIVVADDEFESVILAWEGALARGASLHRVKVHDGESREAALLEAIDTRTRVVAVSHVHPVTGFQTDLQTVAEACAEHNALLVVDGAQALGAVPVDTTGVDVYTAPSFKWFLAGFGLAFFTVSESARSHLEPAFRGYANPPPSPGFEPSHRNYHGICALERSLSLLASIGWSVIYETIRNRREALLAGLDSLATCQVVSQSHSGIVSFETPNVEQTVEALHRKKIRVSLRSGCIRASVHFYNTIQDVDVLVAAMEQLSNELKHHTVGS